VDTGRGYGPWTRVVYIELNGCLLDSRQHQLVAGNSKGKLSRASYRQDSGSAHLLPLKAKFQYAILVADRSEAGRRPAASGNLAYHLAY